MDFDLIVVGLGPVGAVAANLAGQLGLRTLVLDKSQSVYDKPRAMGLDHEIMRILANLGVSEKIAQYVMPYRPSEYRTTDSRVIRRIDAARPPFLQGWAPNYVFMQPQLEGALRENLGRYPSVTVELGAEATSVRSDEEETSVTVQSALGLERTYTADYVLACDGGASPIRAKLGLEMEDLDFDEPWLVVDVILNEGGGATLPTTNVQYCEIARPSTFVVGPGQIRRWEFMINPDETPAQVSQPEYVRKLLSRWLQPEEYEIWRASTYRFHALVLRTWRAGNIFFLGDAAHMTPPFLAQGMCQGIRDAANLLWKLALVKQGTATPALLDTYQAERSPHVRHTTLVTKELGKSICERDPVAAGERDERLLKEMAANPEGTVRQSLIPGLGAGFLSASRHGPRGSLFPQPRVKAANGGSSLLDDFTGAVFRVVIRNTGEASLKQAASACSKLRHLPVQVVLVGREPLANDAPPYAYQDVDGVLIDWMDRQNCDVVIARPDHYVYGACEKVQDVDALLQTFASALQNSQEDCRTPVASA